MREIVKYYKCDVCNTISNDNEDIINVRISKPEIYEEGPIDDAIGDFEICRECAKRCSLNQLIEFFNFGKGSD